MSPAPRRPLPAPAASDARPKAPRLAVIDLARGIAILAMVAYHATWDMGPQFYRLIAVDAGTDPVLRVASKLIAGTFLFLVGVSLVLAHRTGFRPRAYLRRLGFLVLAALAVSAATWLIDRTSFAYFGILHGIAICSLVALPFLRTPVWLTIPAAAFAFAAPALFASAAFNAWPWLWLGLSTDVPFSVDYVPLLPWLGATLLGIAAARIGLRAGLDRTWSRWQPRSWPARALAAAGRWSLAIYLIHQPLLLGLLYLVALAAGTV